MNYKKPPRITWILLALIVLFALWLRSPLIGKDLPFFYNEDEAHHFNRTVNMVKEGDFNPHYFLKPSLHFYMRMPIVAVSFFWNVSKGHLKSIQEIKTGDPFGLKGYSMVASHPGIVKWNRAFSVSLSLLTILLTFLITMNLFGGSFAPLFAAFLVAISPGIISDSATIGVDVVMVFFVALATLITLNIENDRSFKTILFAGLITGLAVSTKYNVWPIALMPTVALFMFRRVSVYNLLLAIITPAIGFLIGSPYILAEIPLFLDHAAYEIWHYKISGHAEHSGEPGLGQALYFYNWFIKSGVGIGPLYLALIGVAVSTIRINRKLLLALFFPVLYFAFMSSQKTNFTRNMLVLIPFLAAFSGGFLVILTSKIRHNIRRLFLIIITPILIYPMLHLTLKDRKLNLTPSVDSRLLLSELLITRADISGDIALSGNLNLPPQSYGLTGVTRIDETKILPSTLFLQGFDYLIVGPSFNPKDDELRLLHLDQFFNGSKEYSRVVKNPEVRIFKFSENILKLLGATTTPTEPECSQNQDYCWINSRLGIINIDPSQLVTHEGTAILKIDLMTPWPNQQVTFQIADWSFIYNFLPESRGEWQTVNLELPLERIAFTPALKVLISNIHSPFSQKLSQDKRRLGVAIKGSGVIFNRDWE